MLTSDSTSLVDKTVTPSAQFAEEVASWPLGYRIEIFSQLLANEMVKVFGKFMAVELKIKDGKVVDIRTVVTLKIHEVQQLE